VRIFHDSWNGLKIPCQTDGTCRLGQGIGLTLGNHDETAIRAKSLHAFDQTGSPLGGERSLDLHSRYVAIGLLDHDRQIPKGKAPGIWNPGEAAVWKKAEQPLLIHAKDTADPKPSPGRIGDFHLPCLRREDGKWRLWFDYWLPGKGVCMGYAENGGEFGLAGDFKIRHDLREPLMENWPNPEIVRIGNTYHSFADPGDYPVKEGESPWKSRQLREAVSADGRNWQLLDFIPPDADTDACQIPQTFVNTIDDRRWLYLFYATQVGSGRNDGEYHYEYDRIRAMRREIVNSK
jgi:hypothetical protein